MKLVLLYTYFNGIEQLEHSFSKMRNLVDEVVICYQKVSHNGIEKVNVFEEIKHFDAHLIEYISNQKLNSKHNERNKHNQLVQFAKTLNATHFILSAVDHVYTKEAIDLAISQNVDVTFTRMFTYYKNENWIIDPPESYYMPFIHKLYQNTEIVKRSYPCFTDESVKVSTMDSYKIFDISECVLHHYSMIRSNIIDKFTNSASSKNWSKEQLSQFIYEWENAKVGDSISYFGGAKIKLSSQNQ